MLKRTEVIAFQNIQDSQQRRSTVGKQAGFYGISAIGADDDGFVAELIIPQICSGVNRIAAFHQNFSPFFNGKWLGSDDHTGHKENSFRHTFGASLYIRPEKLFALMRWIRASNSGGHEHVQDLITIFVFSKKIPGMLR